MKKQAIGMIISMLAIAAMFSAAGTMNSNKINVPSMGSFGGIDEWRMYGHDPLHTGYSTSTAPETNETIIEKVSPSMNTFAGISISKGRAYVTTTFGVAYPLYVFNVYTGELLGIKNFTGATMSTSPVPAIDDKNIYLGAAKESGTGTGVYGLNATTLARRWFFDPGTGLGYGFGSPTLVGDKIYIGGSTPTDSQLWCLTTTTGAKKWNFSMGNYKSCSPAVADGKVYFSSSNSKIYCLDAATGAHLWNFSGGGPVTTSSIVVMNGKVYYGSTDDNLYILDANTGNFIKTVPLGGDPTTAAAHNNKLYIGSTNGKFYCLNATGDELWSFTATGAIRSTPAIADGKVYFGDDGTTAFCLNAETGSKIWEKYVGQMFQRGFVIYDGNVYTLANKKFFGFGSQTGGPATPEKPSGPTSGFVGEVYQYTTSTIDPDDNAVWYKWNWGNQEDNWVGPFLSGEQAVGSHKWSTAGTYNVTVKAKDGYRVESNWSKPLLVIIKEYPQLEINITGGKGITAEIKNTGNGEATEVTWTIKIEGGLFIKPRETGGSIPAIAAGDSEMVTMEVFGIGFGIIKPIPTITVTAGCAENKNASMNVTAIVFLKQVIIRG